MKTLTNFCLLLILFCLISCGSARLTPDNIPNGEPDLNPTGLYDSLADYLRKYPGVEVRDFGGGEGEVYVEIKTIENEVDFTCKNSIDNTSKLEEDKSANSAVDPNNIKRIRIKKSLSETNRYGKDGANGVIEITTLNSN